MRRTFIAVSAVGLADCRAGATGYAVGAEPCITRGNRGVEHSAYSETGLLPAPGASAETDLLEAPSLCACLRQARDG
jgi:hypothetical protein